MTAAAVRAGRGRPRTTGDLTCDRCGRATGKIRVTWPDGRICGICYHHATRTSGICGRCGQQRLLPGRDGQHRLCTACAGITTALTCTRCGTEGERYRRGICARCALRDDLSSLLLPSGQTPIKDAQKLIDALCSAERPESIHTWKRNPDVNQMLSDIGCGRLTLDHAALQAAPASRAREHLRQLLVHASMLPKRDVDLAYFETWLATRLTTFTDPAIRLPLERFATWHHLERIRHRVQHGDDLHGATHTAKQEITETGRFLTWLCSRGQTIADCTQADLEEWLTAGPTTRTAIRTFIVWAGNNKACRPLRVPRRVARTTPILTHDHRMRLLRASLVGQPDTLSYRVAALLLLLYAQPLVRVVQLPLCAVRIDPAGVEVKLGSEPTAVPEPFAALLIKHVKDRPNLRTVNSTGSLWLFPGGRAGRHLVAQTVMIRLRSLGIDLLGARNATLRELVQQAPAPIVASQLGYSTQVTIKHAAASAQPDQRYASSARYRISPGQAATDISEDGGDATRRS